MSEVSVRKVLTVLAVFLGAWLGVKYLLPLLLPFLIGGLIALAAEPAVAFGQRKLRFSRAVSAGIGVTGTMVLLLGLLSVFGAFLVRELGNLAGAVPDLENTARQSMTVLQDWLIAVADRTPEGVRPMLRRTVLNFFNDGTALVEQVTRRVPGMVSSVLGWVPDGALGIGTAVLSAYFISGRLPVIRSALSRRMPESWHSRYLPALKRVRKALTGWLKAQGKLALVTYGIVTVGFLILGIPYGPAWAVLVAVVDAVPMLGTGTVLVPWAVVSLIRGEHFQAIGLLCIFGAAMTTRTALEPRLVGRQLGLDPLLTLLALYLGYRFWGLLGMIAAPILATAAKSVLKPDSHL